MEKTGWWYNPNTKYLKFFTPDKHWGWDSKGNWNILELTPEKINFKNLNIPSESLVTKRIEEELYKRGYIPGVKVKSLTNGWKLRIKNTNFSRARSEYLMEHGQIWLCSEHNYYPLIMKEGVWADIIEGVSKDIPDELLIKCL